MRNKIYILALILFGVFAFLPLSASAQQPCPRVGPCDMPEMSTQQPSGTPPPPTASSAGFNDGLQKFYRIAAEKISETFLTAEKYLNEYFYYVVGILVGIVAMFSMAWNGFKNLENPNFNFVNWVIGAIFFSALVMMTGDIDGDGRGSDAVEWTRYLGYQIAYGANGPTDTTQNTSNPIPLLVNQQVEYYNKAYARFVEGAYTYKYDKNSIPVTMQKPPTSAEDRMRVLFLNTYSMRDAQGNIDLSKKSSEDWISWLFQITELSRTLFELSELFVLLLQAIAASALRLTLPFVIVFSIDPTLRKQLLGGWIDQLFTLCLLLPLVAQIARFITYLFCNMALYSQSDEPYYVYYEQSASVVQEHSPVMTVALFAFISLFMAIILGIGTPAFVIALRTGKILPFFAQSVGAVFSMALSTGLSYATGLLTGSMQEKLAGQRALSEKQISDMSAVNTYLSNADRNMQGFRASSAMSSAETAVGRYNLQTDRESALTMNQFEQQSALVQAGMQFDATSTRSFNELFKSLSTSQMDRVAKELGISGKEMSAMLKHTPEINDLTAKQVDAIPILGALGLGNGMRTTDNLRQMQNWVQDPAAIAKRAEQFGLDKPQTELFNNTIEQMRDGNFPTSKIDSLALPKDAKKFLETLNVLQDTDVFAKDRMAKMRNQFVTDGNFDQQKFMGAFAEQTAKLPGGEKLLSKAGFKPEQIQSLMTSAGFKPEQVESIMSGQGQIGGVMSPTAPKMSGAMRIPKQNQWIPKVINDEARNLGWTDQARLSWLGNTGRENGFNPNTIFNGHLDPASFKNGRGAIYNNGIISWNGERGKALKAELASQGLLKPNGQIVQNEQSLRTMMQFADKEMKTGRWGNQASVMRNPNLSTQQVSKSLQKYILYDNNPANGYNTPDANFDVKNNAKWASSVVGLVNSTSNRNMMIPSSPRPVKTPKLVSYGASTALASSRPTVNYTPLEVNNPMISQNATYQDMQKDLNRMGITMQQTYAPIMSEALELKNERGVANFVEQSQGNIARQTYASEQNLNQRQYDTSVGLAADKRNLSDYMANYRYSRGESALEYMHGVKMGVAQDQLDTYQNIAGRDMNVSMAQNTLRYEHALHEARTQFDINIISSITNDLDRKIADMFEKVNSRV